TGFSVSKYFLKGTSSTQISICNSAYKFSKTKLVLGASMLPNRTWKMTRDKLTHNYFKWDQLWVVK
ncbi:hypothetical protein ABS232_18675, partial [Acinetobacter baumannii]